MFFSWDLEVVGKRKAVCLLTISITPDFFLTENEVREGLCVCLDDECPEDGSEHGRSRKL